MQNRRLHIYLVGVIPHSTQTRNETDETDVEADRIWDNSRIHQRLKSMTDWLRSVVLLFQPRVRGLRFDTSKTMPRSRWT